MKTEPTPEHRAEFHKPYPTPESWAEMEKELATLRAAINAACPANPNETHAQMVMRCVTDLRAQLDAVEKDHDALVKERTDLLFALAAARKDTERLRSLLAVAKCPNCDGSGAVVTGQTCEERVTRDMAFDAGDPSMEGSLYRESEPIVEQCQWCAERAALDAAKKPHMSTFGIEACLITPIDAAKEQGSMTSHPGNFGTLKPLGVEIHSAKEDTK